MVPATKTTLYLPDSLRMRLKTLAAQRKTTVTELVSEGAEMVLARYQGKQDREALRRKADEARAEMRRGFFSSSEVSADDIDAVVYGLRRRRKSK